ncbi:MAG: family 20 glycosylhydrolase [Rikenellaceae bacterium]|nr:family 20 glycosylhydrolase [Rikenellaceae bacterium]
MSMKCLRNWLLVLICAAGSVPAIAQLPAALIPEPREIEVLEGSFRLSQSTGLRADKALARTADLLGDYLTATYGLRLKGGAAGKNTIRLVVDRNAGDEAYTLRVGEDGVTIAGSPAGVFYGTQTLRQLIGQTNDGLAVPYVFITDGPRFGYRGLMLDCGRYFYPVEFVKQYIDLMASYKLNRFHWHLTEDAGWRVEIKKYPELTRIGAWRGSTQRGPDPVRDQDRMPHGGFYTQEQIRDVVRYAADRNVTIVPEVDLPGHTMSVLAAYPELSCTGGPFAVPTTWGIKEDVLCIGNERTIAFVEDVLTELAELFPGGLIHIGGDEAPKRRWHECPKCQALIAQKGLKDEHGLQSYFIHHLQRFAASKGREIMGWDEILEGGLAPGATVMSWRGEQGGIEAARHGNPVVMAPNHYFYFDYYQSKDLAAEPFNIWGYVPLDWVYSYEPYGRELTPEQCRNIRGVQANVWCEFIHDEDKVLYMAYPRVLALSEICWTPAAKRDYGGFVRRLPERLHELDRRGVVFRIPEPLGIDRAEVRGNRVVVALEPLVRDARIYYTTDGSDPMVYGKLYTGQIDVPLAFDGVNIQCVVRLPSGRSSAIYKVTPREKE